ncbi:uncharacterized protein LOC116845044 [Odontomachus brunneus]|uniref:uncharacterized protein LOC116845044 n=1 Tax=Odontomachus brunneus TaxID=486640 RepID=UPI0013F2A33E|nr:uncharacterized protein LOC116845044 [Odontomachus brunneus]XP_032673197.1 uncharacterized protein LOC116845044 [Odontomachus brunneus]
MIVIPIIPFFLGYLARNTSNPTPSYIFHVRIETELFRYSGTHNNEDKADLQFRLKCQPYMDQNLKCHIEKSPSYSPSTDSAYIIDKLSNVRCIMNFQPSGVKSYDVFLQNVKNKETALEVFRFIVHQLNVGVDLKKYDGNEFDAIEETVIGTCKTVYMISRNYARNYIIYSKLVSLIAKEEYIMKKDESVNINKMRNVENCILRNDSILGRILWPNLITPNFTAKPLSSESQMTYTLHNFDTNTMNAFKLYNEQHRIVGSVQETINLKLIKIEN